jgi:hypothetical protein
LSFRSSFGTYATAETAEGTWTYKRVGFLNPRVTVRIAGAEEDMAIYHPKFWGDGILTLKEGPTFTWRPTNFWRTHWEFADEEGQVVLTFESGVVQLKDIFKTQATIRFEHVAEHRSLLPLLASLGIYLIVLHNQDAAAAAAATSAAAG